LVAAPSSHFVRVAAPAVSPWRVVTRALPWLAASWVLTNDGFMTAARVSVMAIELKAERFDIVLHLESRARAWHDGCS
jgi:hypothetical protein